MKNSRKTPTKTTKRKKKKRINSKLRKRVQDRLERWNRMLAGDTRAIIESTVDRGMATKEDFPEYFGKRNARA